MEVTLEQIKQAFAEVAQTNAILSEVSYIKDHLKTLNGTVAEHTKQINEVEKKVALHNNTAESELKTRAATCPVKGSIVEKVEQLEEDIEKRLRPLEDESKVVLGKKQFVIGAIGLIAVLLGIFVSTIKINEYVSNKNMETVIEKIIEKRINER